jgi:hypothetical protein
MFAQALDNKENVPILKILIPCIKGDSVYIKTTQDEYVKGVEGLGSQYNKLIIIYGCTWYKLF